jgi:hypothetical protein
MRTKTGLPEAKSPQANPFFLDSAPARSVQATGGQGALDLRDGFGDMNVPRTGLGAVESGTAAPHPGLLVEDLKPLGRAAIARVENKAMGIDQGSRAVVFPIGPEDWAGGRAGRAQDAFGGVVITLALFWALQALFAIRDRVIGTHEIRQNGPVMLPEGFHIDDHVFDHRQADQGLDGDMLAHILHQHLAGQAVAPVDAHGV